MVDSLQSRLGIFLPEFGLPFHAALAKTKELGASCVWFSRLDETSPPIAEMSDRAVDEMGEAVASQGLRLFLILADTPFKQIHLTDLSLERMEQDEAFQRDFAALVRSMQIATRLGVGAVGSFTFAWPGEYSAGKPTWPMRWLTRGGYIADVDMEKLVKAFSLVLQQAERYGVDLSLSMMPWNYTSTTGNFRRLAERLNSKRLKVTWGPADNLNSGEWDVASAGFLNVRPYLHTLHIKDLRVLDGLRLKFEYCPLGEGDVDYPTILRSIWEEPSDLASPATNHDLVLSVSTHFLPPSGSREEAVRINVANLKAMIARIQQTQSEPVQA